MPFIERLVGRISLAALLESIRLGEEMTQREFAAKLGVSKSHLCDIEKGRKLVSPERAARFAKELGYSSDQFVRLALQDAIDRAGLRYTVQVTAA
ncbi:MAG: helix-turn-helix transcriptional regulator [Deltaproteobacteria bacterium]|nr:helix-turn-helix transcriptional regulator [Deltaproteobacteria bacterium]